MKEFNKVVLHILFWITVPVLIFYFKWAAQETTSLPGLPVSESASYIEIVKSNKDVFIVSLFGSIPIFYLSLFFLTPKLLFKGSLMKIVVYAASLTTYFLAILFLTNFIFPMYYFFGTPYAIKMLVPIVLFSGLAGTLFAFKEKLQEKSL